jgi:hypothetical protein
MLKVNTERDEKKLEFYFDIILIRINYLLDYKRNRTKSS